ncbi:Splicing factor RBM39, linker, partial [Dillenia turbinata]
MRGGSRDREKELREKEREFDPRESSNSTDCVVGRTQMVASMEQNLEAEPAPESKRYRDKKEVVEPEVDPERDQRTVFAYQMPLKATERDVYEFFSKAGKVRDVRLIMDRNSRRSKGVGYKLVHYPVDIRYIEFYDAMSVPMAIALSGQLLLGQPVMVKPSEAEKNLVQSTASAGAGGAAVARKLYVGNLHFNMTELQLRQIFEAFGPVELVQLPLDQETGQCKGFGFVQFAELEHAKAAQTLNGKLEIAGRLIKVSSVTDHIGVQDSGTNNADFDDDGGGGGGLALNAQSRAMLMLKLDRSGSTTSIAGSLGVSALNGSIPNQQGITMPLNGLAAVTTAAPSALVATSPASAHVGNPSPCLLLKNMFDPANEEDPDFDLDIKDEVREECSKFGPVRHIYVDKNGAGHVYLRFDTVEAAASAQRAMHMRWYACRPISAIFMQPSEYEAKFNG